MKKRIPIGQEDFKVMIENELYYVDKTLMIRDIANSGATVNLFTRPRRFGKTLNLSMIRRFFEDERKRDGEKIDNGNLFDGLAIMNAGEKYTSMQQQYPVINLSLKSAKQSNFQMAYGSLIGEIADEFKRHKYILSDTSLDEEEKEQYMRMMYKKAEPIEYAKGIQFLSRCLELYHEKKVIILIDEYDVPLESAYFKGFYDEMVEFIRSLFESALKTNSSLAFGIVTGCLRISKESIFTGLNNLDIHSVRNVEFEEFFGFTQPEIDEMLTYYGLEEKRAEMKEWYDGYRFGKTEIYNPWSILKYVKIALVDSKALPESYWANTSSNDIIRELVENADAETKAEMERLINGETIEKPIHEEITYGDIHKSMDNLWNFLFFTGYMKNCGEKLVDGQIYMKMSIPNMEIKSIYKNMIIEWFGQKIKNTELDDLYSSIVTGDTKTFGEQVTKQLQDTISFFDYAENYYHGFLAGLLKGMPNYRVVSNRESGDGRADLILQENEFMGKAILIEVKITDKFSEMELKCDEALKQIDEKQYARPLIDDGYQEIKKYGICFFKKGCMVKKEN